MPDEYLDYWLCTKAYHCTPSQLDREDPLRIEEHLACLEAEAQVERLRRAGQKRGR